MFNPLKNFFPENDMPLSFEDVNWSGLGVDNKFIILLTGRSGSTMLTKLIEGTAVCGNPDEFFNESYIKYAKSESCVHFLEYFEKIVKDNKKGSFFGFEIDAQRFFWLKELMKLDGALSCDSDIPVVWLTRQDLVSQAYSFAVAKKTGVWHRHSDGKSSQTESVKGADVIDDGFIWKELLLVLEWEQKIESLFDERKFSPLRVTYEQLVADKVTTLARILAHIGLPVDAVNEAMSNISESTPSTLKLDYAGKVDFLVRFYNKYSGFINEINSDRKNINLENLAHRLRDGGVSLS